MASLPLQKSEVTLGLDVQGLTAALAEQFELQETVGVLVTKVEQGGLAHSEGVQEGDLINEVNRQTVRTVTQFSEEVAKVKPGQTVLLRIIRKAEGIFHCDQNAAIAFLSVYHQGISARKRLPFLFYVLPLCD